MFEDEYQLDFFKRNGFFRKTCPSCNSAFWTRDSERKLCGDTPCVEYGFIGKPITSRPYTMDEMRRVFLDYFHERGHGIVDPYPVVARWRND
ncbi:MAG: hypothetical protein KAT70_06240, partial [Thermoplasmata archaeon]|nr:hypothetical protein [Thermoplasmata archaeon]